MDSYPDPGTHICVQIIVLLVILLSIALLNAAKTALDECSRNKIKAMSAEGNVKAENLLKLIDNPQSFIDCANTFIVFGLVVAGFFGATSLSFFIAVIICMVVLGVFFPRRIAILHPEGVALSLSGFLSKLLIIVRPFAAINNVLVNILLRLTRQNTSLEEEEFSEDEVMDMLEVGQESGALKEEGKKMINSIFEFDDKLAYEIMTPRTDVFLIDVNDPAEEYLDELMELKFSRIPVYDNDSDNIIGILYIKDWFAKAREHGFENVDIRDILRKPYFVPETKNIDSLFVNLQSTKNQIAILIDEFGGFSGIVTMEDIIEEVMGDIEDEYDEKELDIEQVSPDTYLVDGGTDLDDIEEQFGIELVSDNSETVGGYILDILGEIPEDGDDLAVEIEDERCSFVIKQVHERRIEKVLLTIHPAKADSESGEAAGTETGK